MEDKMVRQHTQDVGKRLFIELGSSLLLENGDNAAINGSFIGMNVGEYLIMKPSAEEIDPQTLDEVPLTLKYRQNAEILGFECKLIAHIESPEPLLFIEYPKAITNYNIRRNYRIDCFLPVEIEFGHALVEAKVVNISREGCMCRMHHIHLPDLSAIKQVTMIFESDQLNTPIEISGLVRSIKLDEQLVVLGIEFIHQNLAFEVALQTLVPNLSTSSQGDDNLGINPL